jgi:hypothetical protein
MWDKLPYHTKVWIMATQDAVNTLEQVVEHVNTKKEE